MLTCTFVGCAQAIEGHYIDKKCPFTGNVSIRGRILTGIVLKMKMQRTIVIRRDYLHYVRKYSRFEKRHKNLSVHLSPCFRSESVLLPSVESRDYSASSVSLVKHRKQCYCEHLYAYFIIIFSVQMIEYSTKSIALYR